MDEQPHSVSATLRLAARIALIAAVVTALALFLWQIALVLLLVFAAVLGAIFLRSLADWAARWTGLSARWALGLVLVTLTAAATVAVLFSGQSVADQMVQLADEIPRSLGKLKEQLHVAILFLAIQTVESYVISPLIQQRTVSLPPALTITARVAMGSSLAAPEPSWQRRWRRR